MKCRKNWILLEGAVKEALDNQGSALAKRVRSWYDKAAEMMACRRGSDALKYVQQILSKFS